MKKRATLQWSSLAMYFLAYISRANSPHVSKDIEGILKVAAKNNLALSVTGMLLIRSGIFFQLLEGDKKDVLAIFEKIAKDKRHKKLEILIEAEEPGSKRLFPNWSMGLVGEPDGDSEQNKILDILHSTVTSTKPKKERIVTLLKKFSMLQPMSAQDIIARSSLAK